MFRHILCVASDFEYARRQFSSFVPAHQVGLILLALLLSIDKNESQGHSLCILATQHAIFYAYYCRPTQQLALGPFHIMSWCATTY